MRWSILRVMIPRFVPRALAAVSLLAVFVVVGGCSKSSSSAPADTQASRDANCAFVCADLLEGCPSIAKDRPDCQKKCATDAASVGKTSACVAQYKGKPVGSRCGDAMKCLSK